MVHGVCSDFIAVFCNDPDFPDSMNHHCVIHQQAVAGKIVDFSHVMTLVVNLINSGTSKSISASLIQGITE